MSTTMERLGDIGTTIAAVGAGVTGGVLFGFSTFVMRALDALPADQAIASMQSINRQAPTAGFMTAMFGTAVVAIALGVDGLRRFHDPDGKVLTAGSGLYLASILVTVAFHVPRNDRLARIVTPAAGASDIWNRYSSTWTAGNHVRTALAITASILFTLARAQPR
jgi:uncharacterized membrane protein